MAVALVTGSVRMSATLSWQQQKLITGFLAATQNGPANANASPTIGASDANQVYPVQGTIAAAGSVTINFSGLTMPAFGDILNPVRIYGLLVLGTGSTWTYDLTGVSPLAFKISTGALLTMADGDFVQLGGSGSSAITGAAKNLILNNVGGATLAYTLAAILGA